MERWCKTVLIGLLAVVFACPARSETVYFLVAEMIEPPAHGDSYVLLLELQTVWDQDKILVLIEYLARYQRRYPNREVRPVLLLLTGKAGAGGEYSHPYLTFRYHLI